MDSQDTRGGVILETYQWLPTRKELKRKRFPQKGKGGFRHPYIWEDEPVETDYPNGEIGPAEHLYTDTIGASSRKEEPLKMSEIKLRGQNTGPLLMSEMWTHGE